MFVDLHIHSYFSDGAQTPEQAALACRDSGVGLAALCDHNSWLGCERFAAACEALGVQSIRGRNSTAAGRGTTCISWGMALPPRRSWPPLPTAAGSCCCK